MGAGPRNFSTNPDLERRLHDAVSSADKAAIRAVSAENRREGGCTGHMKAAAVKALVPDGFWQQAFKFRSERHPYEKAVSMAFFSYRGPRNDKAAFNQHLDEVVRNPGAYRSWNIYTIAGKPVVDAWVLHGSLERDFASVLDRLGLSIPNELPRARSKQRVDRTPATEILTTAHKTIVQEACASEFQLFDWPV